MNWKDYLKPEEADLLEKLRTQRAELRCARKRIIDRCCARMKRDAMREPK